MRSACAVRRACAVGSEGVCRGEGCRMVRGVAPELGCTKRFVSTWCSAVFRSHLHVVMR